MTRKDTVLRILIVVGVLYSALLIVMIIFFAMGAQALSGLRISYENPNPQTETVMEEESTLPADMDPASYPASYLEAM